MAAVALVKHTVILNIHKTSKALKVVEAIVVMAMEIVIAKGNSS